MIFFYKLSRLEMQKLEKRSAFLNRPEIIGFYEYDHEIVSSGKRMKYFKEPKVSDYPLDLKYSENITPYLTRCRNIKSRLKLPIDYAMSTESGTAYKIKGKGLTTVYTSRRVLTKLMEWNYDRQNFTIHVSCYKGKIYMAGDLVVYTTAPKNSHHERLEQILFADSPHELPKIDVPIDDDIGLSCLNRTVIGKYDIMYAGEVQGIISNKTFNEYDDMNSLNQCRFVFAKQIWASGNKTKQLLKFWIQVSLARVDELYLALKNNQDIVETPMEHYNVCNIPNEPKCFWKPKVCMGVMHDFIERVDRLMADVESLDTVYEFNFNGCNKSVHYIVHEGKTDKSFISNEYIKFVGKASDMN